MKRFLCVLGLAALLGGCSKPEQVKDVELVRKLAEQGDAVAQEMLRGSAGRPFSKFKEMTQEANERYTEQIKKVDEKMAEVGEELSALMQQQGNNQEIVLSAEVAEKIKDLRALEVTAARSKKELQRELRKAAEQDYAEAQNNLGGMYANGRGVAKDHAAATKWYRKSADQGYAKAQYNLGVMYGKGYGVAKDDEEAVKWFRKAAEQGNAGAQYNLGFMNEYGRGVTKNETEAVKWYRMAADRGDTDAQRALNNLGGE